MSTRKYAFRTIFSRFLNHYLFSLDNHNFVTFNHQFFVGPTLPKPLFGHEMVPLGNGQAIIGGFSTNSDNSKTFMVTCSNRNCKLEILRQELSVPRGWFVAMPIPTNMTECNVLTV